MSKYATQKQVYDFTKREIRAEVYKLNGRITDVTMTFGENQDRLLKRLFKSIELLGDVIDKVIDLESEVKKLQPVKKVVKKTAKKSHHKKK